MKALLELPDEINQTLNIVKAQHNLKNKAEVITLLVKTYEQEHMEPELLPAFVKKIQKTDHLRGRQFTSIDELRKRYS